MDAAVGHRSREAPEAWILTRTLHDLDNQRNHTLLDRVKQNYHIRRSQQNPLQVQNRIVLLHILVPV
jgi:hypothetical protein